MDIGNLILFIAVCAAWFALSFFLCVLLHETGHLIGGRLSGYRLAGFAIMGLMFGKMVTRYRSGTLNPGQCFMYPRDGEDRNPAFLILGGCIMNLLIGTMLAVPAVVSFAKGVSSVNDMYAPVLLSIPAVLNLIMGISNLFFGSATSDGKTYAESRADTEHRREYNAIMSITRYLIEGKPFGRMPEELFRYGTDWKENSLSAEMRLYCYYRKLEQADTMSAFTEIATSYGFRGNEWKQCRFFTDENRIEHDLYEKVLKQGKRRGRKDTGEDEEMPPLRRADLMGEDYYCASPFPGLYASFMAMDKCLMKIMREGNVE